MSRLIFWKFRWSVTRTLPRQNALAILWDAQKEELYYFRLKRVKRVKLDNCCRWTLLVSYPPSRRSIKVPFEFWPIRGASHISSRAPNSFAWHRNDWLANSRDKGHPYLANLEGYPAQLFVSLYLSLDNFMDLKEREGETQRNKAPLHCMVIVRRSHVKLKLHDTECMSVSNEVLIGSC